MSIEYIGYIYIWYDTKAKFFYIGGHKGTPEDSYICSNKKMLNAYKKRPDSFRFRVLEYVQGTLKDLRESEQKWLNMIKDEELYWTPNIYNETVKYYNMKKNSAGGNGSANKGNKNIGGWNRGLKGVQDYSNPLHRKKRSESAKKRWAREKGESV